MFPRSGGRVILTPMATMVSRWELGLRTAVEVESKAGGVESWSERY